MSAITSNSDSALRDTAGKCAQTNPISVLAKASSVDVGICEIRENNVGPKVSAGRKRNVAFQSDEPEVISLDDSPKKKIRRVELKLVPMLKKLDGNILNNSIYHRFLNSLEKLEGIDYCAHDDPEEENVSYELLIPIHQLSDLCFQTAKLKAERAMEVIPTNKIVRLLTLLEKNIRKGCKVTPLADHDDNEDESRLWLELTMESISRGVLATLTALHILTSQNMPSRVYLEDLIERMVIFTKYQIQYTIFPAFDPVYRVNPKGKDELSSGKRKRTQAQKVQEKSMISFYNKIHEVVGLLAELLNVQVLTETTLLHLSTVGVSPFFVENVSELQLSALKLVTAIFTQYENHRRWLLDDILASIARLPSNKRNLRTFKLSSGSGECIQMLTALVLQLIQSVTHLPDKLATSSNDIENIKDKQLNSELDAIIGGKYDTAMRSAGNFLTVFLSKCGSKSEDCDYRLLFENFVQDLLSTLNKPQWPAAELLLSLVGTLLVQNLSNKNLEISMRVASLEWLGIAVARLRKDAVSTQRRMGTIDRIISDIKAEEEQFDEKEGDKDDFDSDVEKTEFLQRLLLDYMAVNGQSDASLMHVRHFYIASWWKSAPKDIANSFKNNPGVIKQNKIKKKKKNKGSSDEESETEDSDVKGPEDNAETNAQVLQMIERRKHFLLTKIRPFSGRTSRKTEVVQTYVDSKSAELISRYLASKRPLSASFDFFLKRILSVSTEQNVALRTKALRCLTMIVEADPSVLGRDDIQLWVQHSFLDQSIAVREATVDVVGKYVLSFPDLIDKYYETLSLRILDTGISVRKRVIKILRDICIECPSFEKIPEICAKMIRRVNDEEGIRKLVMEVFQNMWFTAVKENPLGTQALLRKVSHITEVVASCEKVGLDFFEHLLLSLFKPKDDKDDVREKAVEPPKAVVTASTQIVNCLVQHVLRLEESSSETAPSSSSSSSQRFAACVATLYLFAKIRPQLLVNHALTLQGYLHLRCLSHGEVTAIANICSILELVVPLLVNPSESFLAQLEEDCVKLVFKNEKNIIDSCLPCLGAVINKITHNYKIVRNVFRRFQNVLMKQTAMIRENPSDPQLNEWRPHLRRAIYTLGLFLRYFDFTQPDVYGDFVEDTVDNVFNELMFLSEGCSSDLQYCSLQAIGNLCIRHYDFMLGNNLKRVYQQFLTQSAENKLKVQVLANIQLYLTEEELRMIKQGKEWTKSDKENIKEIGDVTSAMASTIVQIHLKQILEAFLSSDLSVRLAAVRVIQLVLQQGLVHPIQIVPYLISMSTEVEQGVSTTADKQLQEMKKKHPQFLQSQVLNGIRLSLQLQRILNGYTGTVTSGTNVQNATEHLAINDDRIPIVRGYRQQPKEIPAALNGFLYSLLRSTKPQRRAFALSLLKQFDEPNKNRLADLLYYADNLAYFPYQVVDEPLFIIHHIDMVLSVTGSNLLQAFEESLIPVNNPADPVDDVNSENSLENLQNPEVATNEVTDAIEDEEDEDVDSLVKRLPEDTKTLEQCIIASQGCLLLLMLKQHLKDSYGITDARISSYSPSDTAKTFERPVIRRNSPNFEPKCTLDNLRNPPSGSTPDGRRALIELYIHFKQQMLQIDSEEEDEDEEAKPVKLKNGQNLSTYSLRNTPVRGGHDNHQGNASFASSSASVVPAQSHAIPANAAMRNSTSVNVQQYVSTSKANAVPEQVGRVPKLTLVPLKFPGSENRKVSSHKIEDRHQHKHKKLKRKKKKRYTVTNEDESDNTDSDPDFRL